MTTTNNNTNKATHFGTCQLCGSLQKLPGSRLATHGYSVEYGYFSGVCQGSNELPWELSKDFAERILKSTVAWEAANRDRIEALPAIRENAPEKYTLRGSRTFIKEMSQRLAGWKPGKLRPVLEIETEKRTKTEATKKRNFKSRELKDAKWELSKLVDGFSSVFLSAADSVVTREERNTGETPFGKWFFAFYYSASAPSVAKFSRTPAPDADAEKVKAIMTPLCLQIALAASKVASLKAAK